MRRNAELDYNPSTILRIVARSLPSRTQMSGQYRPFNDEFIGAITLWRFRSVIQRSFIRVNAWDLD